MQTYRRLESLISNARNLTPFQLGFCTICPTSLFLSDFIEVVRTDSTNDADHPLQTLKLFFVSQPPLRPLTSQCDVLVCGRLLLQLIYVFVT